MEPESSSLVYHWSRLRYISFQTNSLPLKIGPPQKERIVCRSIAVSFRESTFLKDFGNFLIVPKKFPNKNNWLVVKKHFFVNPLRINRDPNEIHPPWNSHSPWNLVVGRLLSLWEGAIFRDELFAAFAKFDRQQIHRNFLQKNPPLQAWGL